MYENRSAAYWQLIQKLLKSSKGEESQILNAHSDLLDPGLLATIIAVAKQFDDGNQNEANFLTNIALELGKFLGNDHQPTAIRKQTGDILLNWGTEQYYISHIFAAFQCWQQSLIIYQAIHDRQGEASSFGNLGITYCSLGEYEQAIAVYEKSLVISREIKYGEGEASSLGGLGIAYYYLGEYERAISFHEQHLAISREIKNRFGEASSLGGLGTAYDSLGEYERAIAFHEKSLAIFQEIKNRQGEASSLGSLGNSYRSLGQNERGIAFYEKSLAIFQEIENRQGAASSLGGLGTAYDSLGEYERAIDYHEQSLAIFQDINNRQGEASSIAALGNAYYSLGQIERAIAFYEQSLAIFQEIKNRQGEASSLAGLGIAYHSLGEYERAIDYHEQSLAIEREIKNRQGEANSLNNIGIVYRRLQETEKAIKNYRDSLKIATPKTMPAECLKAGRNLGNIGFTQGDWHLALEGYEPAIKAVEQLRKGSTTDKRRQEIIKEAISVYANAVQCYINLKQYDRAVETADRSRSRHLADLFASKDLYPQGEIPPEVEEYYRLQQQSDRLRISENDGTKAITATRQPIPNGDAIIEKIKELEDEKQKAWLKIRSKDQVLAAQLQPAPLSFDQMQALIPDAETAILNFYTTDEHIHIFILRQNQSTQLHTCEGQGYETLQGWLIDNWLKPYKEKPIAWQNQMGEFLPELANRLQINQLISQHLNGIKELIIIPHLYLHQMPFAALPLNNSPIPHSNTPSDRTRGLKPLSKPTLTPAKTPPQKQPEYLSDKFRIRIVPSCQILNFCHQRGNLKPATMGIVENATGDLVFTGYECETLATMHQIDKNSRLQYQQATIGNYHNLLNQVQVLHSSHHASADLNNSLESKLHLFDGDINLGRVFTWRFTDLAEVFLSCCETNLTFTQITDDPLSIASGFLCAGARNVVSTLWAVDDLATALFCILYYQEKQHNSRSEALRKAQLNLRNLTGDELSAKYKRHLEDYFEQQQKGEQQAEIVKNVRLRLDWLGRQELPFVSPYNWAGFVSQGLA
ncbi:CHAT domain-containing tetratricopeptide repeat protein [Microcoleus sp. B9-D4]|uniref:CHAT domain-containing tetratricopeptide repeat protein n=1 Tax=Microcoleus sp. B9-D4 TaxID=2818711 RepID=UPI002FD3DF73